MAIFMDRHDLSDKVTAEVVAELHKADLKVQDQFGCRGLTYWFDGERGTAFCLVEAPSKRALKQMHRYAHGQVPNQIIEVDPQTVTSFLGALHPYSLGGAYLNFEMSEGQVRIKASYKENYQRLATIKRKYDPSNLFRVNQNILPAQDNFSK